MTKSSFVECIIQAIVGMDSSLRAHLMSSEQLDREIRARDLESVIKRTEMLRHEWEDQLQKNPRAEHNLIGMRKGVVVDAQPMNKDKRDTQKGFRSGLERQGLAPEQMARRYKAHINEFPLHCRISSGAIEHISYELRNVSAHSLGGRSSFWAKSMMLL